MLEYSCGRCGADKCKLWRASHVLLNQVELICWTCLETIGHMIRLHASNQELDWRKRRSDQVYTPAIESTNYVPAVPDLDGSFWGYTSVPGWWVAWWKALPDKGSDCTACLGTGRLGEFDCMFCKGSGQRKETRGEEDPQGPPQDDQSSQPN